MKDQLGAVPPLPADVEEFLRPERDDASPPPGIDREIFSRLRATLGLPGGSGGDGGGGDGGGAVGGESGPHVATGVGQLVHAHPLVAALATFLAGAGVGAGGHAILDRRVERRSALASLKAPMTSRAAASAVEQPPARAPLPAAEPTILPAAPGAGRLPAAEPKAAGRDPESELRERDRKLGAERTLLEQARTALVRAKGETALRALERHAREFPRGELEEERESLLVQALVEVERYDEARDFATRFHRQFPRSIFGPMVEEALRSIP
jgi:hypothetical protein